MLAFDMTLVSIQITNQFVGLFSTLTICIQRLTGLKYACETECAILNMQTFDQLITCVNDPM
jgi:hypothetical protein